MSWSSNLPISRHPNNCDVQQFTRPFQEQVRISINRPLLSSTIESIDYKCLVYGIIDGSVDTTSPPDLLLPNGGWLIWAALFWPPVPDRLICFYYSGKRIGRQPRAFITVWDFPLSWNILHLSPIVILISRSVDEKIVLPSSAMGWSENQIGLIVHSAQE